jgi:hypothetical protein
MPFQPRQTYSEVLLLKTIVSLRNAAKTKQNKTKQNLVASNNFNNS